MPKVMVQLPTYDLGPGRDQDELVVNVLVYGMFLALLLTVLWVLLPFAQHRRQRKRDD
jgi:hypothetical protein